MPKIARTLLIAAFVGMSGGCSQNSHGSESPSPDGNTYLIVEEPEGCPVVMIDGAVWQHRRGAQGEIAPGEHVIKCATPIRFSIRQGMVFSFSNWTP